MKCPRCNSAPVERADEKLHCTNCGFDWDDAVMDVIRTPEPTPAPRVSSSVPDPIMPFGKHQGKRCSQITDVKYLDWIIGAGFVKQPLLGQITAHLKSRADWKRL